MASDVPLWEEAEAWGYPPTIVALCRELEEVAMEKRIHTLSDMDYPLSPAVLGAIEIVQQYVRSHPHPEPSAP